MTFEELLNEKTQETVFDGTEVDAATQNLLVEWFFDYDLSVDTCDDPTHTIWLKYWKRNCNLYYPRYLQLLRVLAVKENLDPYVTQYLEQVTQTTAESETNRESERTPELEREETRTPRVETTNLRTPNLHDTSVITGGHTDTRTPNTETVTETESQSEQSSVAKSDGFGIAYPETQLQNVELDLDIDTPRAINYAANENLSGSNSAATGQDETTQTTTETGTETNQTVYNSETTTNASTGTETSVTSTTGSDTIVSTETGSDTTVEVTSQNNTSDVGMVQKGRNESVADIIPRAMSAIINSDAFTWFKGQLKNCFYLYY